MGLRKHNAGSGLQFIYTLAAAAVVLRHHNCQLCTHLLLQGNLSPLGRGHGVWNDGSSEIADL